MRDAVFIIAATNRYKSAGGWWPAGNWFARPTTNKWGGDANTCWKWIRWYRKFQVPQYWSPWKVGYSKRWRSRWSRSIDDYWLLRVWNARAKTANIWSQWGKSRVIWRCWWLRAIVTTIWIWGGRRSSLWKWRNCQPPSEALEIYHNKAHSIDTDWSIG